MCPLPPFRRNLYAPYKYEIDMLRKGVFNPHMKEDIIRDNEQL